MLLQTCTARRQLSTRRSSSSFWALLPLEDLQDPWFVHVPLGIGTLGRRVAPLSVQYTLS